MIVNSFIKMVFYNRWTILCGVPMAIGIAMFTILVITSSFTKRAPRDLQAKQVNLLIRQIGHRLLLQAGDSTSRIMPVTELKKGTFQLRFENDLVFNHDSLMVLAQELFPKAQFPSGYTITVHDCKQGDIVYGFQVNNNLPNVLPCSGRSQPIGCYSFEFAFLDFYKNAPAEQPAERALLLKVDPQSTPSKQEGFGKGSNEQDIGKLTEQLKSFKDNPNNVESLPAISSKEFKSTTADYPMSNFIYSGVLALLAGALLIARFGKIFTPTSSKHQDKEVTRPVLELPAIGKFLFDVKNQRLLSGTEIIRLTDKESRVLELLNKSFGELIARETLIQEIWINEGVITGRSLDMFVSKLRKKLSSDPELRITNVHGKGYRLEICEMEFS